ncbi:MAG TPA: hypothetical protein VFE58_13590 [Tepidisphaeraceae bacterium]|jgi:hypothetical protein|nr:hypothetical protein [Tepidisphaeraceae bacterium]
MPCFTCSSSHTLSPVFKSLSRAAAKYAGSKLRSAGLLPTSNQWLARTAICARCPLYTLREGRAFCGKPFPESITRPPTEGCGCPLAAKARSPAEHCPLTPQYHPASDKPATPCDCKWCASAP